MPHSPKVSRAAGRSGSPRAVASAGSIRSSPAEGDDVAAEPVGAGVELAPRSGLNQIASKRLSRWVSVVPPRKVVTRARCTPASAGRAPGGARRPASAVRARASPTWIVRVVCALRARHRLRGRWSGGRRRAASAGSTRPTRGGDVSSGLDGRVLARGARRGFRLVDGLLARRCSRRASVASTAASTAGRGTGGSRVVRSWPSVVSPERSVGRLRPADGPPVAGVPLARGNQV